MSCWIFHEHTEWNRWAQHELHLQFKQGHEIILPESIRLNWLAENNTWQHVSLEYPLDRVSHHPDKPLEVRVFFHYKGSEIPLYIDDLCVELIREKDKPWFSNIWK